MSVPPDPTLLREVGDDGKEIAPPVARRLFDLVTPAANSKDELFKSRLLCRGGAVLFVGQTGIGKSTFMLQGMIHWALGRKFFGIIPARPLRFLLIQAENDDGDLAEMRDGVLRGLNLTEKEKKKVASNTLVHSECSMTSDAFFANVVEPLVSANAPDILIIDPALAYLGGESSSQRDVGHFLRNRLLPILKKYDCACIIVHHTNKPPKEKPHWVGADHAYLGGGSAEWANSVRAVWILNGTEAQGVYEFRLAKRGGRAGWKNSDGDRAYSRYVKHSDAALCWTDADESEIPERKTGRAPKHSIADLLLYLADGATTTDWQERCNSEGGISRSRFYEILKDAKTQGAAVQLDEKWSAIPNWRPNATSFVISQSPASGTISAKSSPLNLYESP